MDTILGHFITLHSGESEISFRRIVPPVADSIARPIDLKPSTLPLCCDCPLYFPFPTKHPDEYIHIYYRGIRSALDCWSTGRVINPAPGSGFMSPAWYSLVVHNWWPTRPFVSYTFIYYIYLIIICV